MSDHQTNTPYPSTSADETLYQRAVKSGGWVFVSRLAQVVLSFLRRIILARLLFPRDFGIFGIGLLVISTLEMFTDTGLNKALIHKKNNIKPYLDTVWTFGIIRATVLYIVLYFSAPIIINFFDRPDNFTHEDIRQPYQFIGLLSSQKRSADKYIFQQLSADTKSQLAQQFQDDNISESFLIQLSLEIENILQNYHFYNSGNFGNRLESKYFNHLLQHSQSPDVRYRLNRRLLENAYIHEIRPIIVDKFLAIDVVRMIGLAFFLIAFSNVGMIYFQKNLKFNRIFIIQFTDIIISVTVSVTIAYIYRSVWALVWGRLAASSTTLFLSYILHPHRSHFRIETKKFRELWAYGKHVLLNSIVRFFSANGDNIILGRMLGITFLGYYQQAFQWSTLVSREVGNRISEVTFPAYTRLQENLPKLHAAYFKSLQVTSMIAIPFSGLLFVLGHELTLILLGDKWLPMVPALKILGLSSILSCLQRGPMFMSIGRPDIITKMGVFRLILLIVTIYPFTKYFGMPGTAISVVLSSLLVQPIGFYLLHKLVGIKSKKVAICLFIPTLACLGMMGIVFGAKLVLVKNSIISLLIFIFTALISYIIFLFVIGKLFNDNRLLIIKDIVKGFK